MLAALVVACSAAPRESEFRGVGGNGEWVLPAGCEVEPIHVDGEPPPDCDPCIGRLLADGASCGDLSPGFECERGDHPAWVCNEIWRCSDELAWHQIQGRRTTGECAREAVRGGICEPTNQPTCGVPPDGMVCRVDGYYGKFVVARSGGQSHEARLSRRVRLGCPCGDARAACYTGLHCAADGHYRIGDEICPPPP